MKRRVPRPSELAPLLQFRRPQLSPTKRRLESALRTTQFRFAELQQRRQFAGPGHASLHRASS